MDEIHVHKTKKSICAHFAESPCIYRVSTPSVDCLFFEKLTNKIKYYKMLRFIG